MKAVLSALLFATSLSASASEYISGGVDLASSATTLSSYGWVEDFDGSTLHTLRGQHYIYDATSYAIIGRTPFEVPCVQDAWAVVHCKWTHLQTSAGAIGRCYRAAVGVNSTDSSGRVFAQNSFGSGLLCLRDPGDCTGGGPLPTSAEPALPDLGAHGGPERVGVNEVPAGESGVASEAWSPGREPIGTQGAGGCGTSPIVVDLTGDDFRLSDDPVFFDLDADGVPEKTNWTAPHAEIAFLVLDRNGNGRVDDGTELFGDHTPLSTGERAPYGFVALAEYDLNAFGGNFDGYLSPEDSIWPKLRLWIDRNHDGQSQADELETLDQAGILKIQADYEATSRKDRFGNRFVAKGKAWRENRHGEPKELAVWDVVFVRR